MTVLCICAWIAFVCSPQRSMVFFCCVTWLLLACSCGLINGEVFLKATGLLYLSYKGDALLPTLVQHLQSSPSLCLLYKERIPPLPKDRQTATEESRGRDMVKQAGKSFSFRSFPSVSWSERALRIHWMPALPRLSSSVPQRAIMHILE